MHPVGCFVRVLFAARQEEVFESLPELSAHDAVEHEVDSTVDQHNDVHDVAEWHVDALEDVSIHTAQEGQDALRQFGDHEAEYDRHQHRRGSVVLTRALGLCSLALRLESAPLFIRLLHGLY